MQHVRGGAAASGLCLAVSRSRSGFRDVLHRHALCVPLQLPYSECVRVGWGDLDFGGDNGGKVEGTGGYSDGRAGVASSVGSVKVR
jgi:hypothetical protein